VGVIQRRSGTGFALKPLQCLGIARDLGGEKLEGYITAEAGILRFVNHTHATATQSLDDAIMRDGLSDLYGFHSLANKDAAVGHAKSIPGFWTQDSGPGFWTRILDGDAGKPLPWNYFRVLHCPSGLSTELFCQLLPLSLAFHD
jgi:hypothetical protein